MTASLVVHVNQSAQQTQSVKAIPFMLLILIPVLSAWVIMIHLNVWQYAQWSASLKRNYKPPLIIDHEYTNAPLLERLCFNNKLFFAMQG